MASSDSELTIVFYPASDLTGTGMEGNLPLIGKLAAVGQAQIYVVDR